MDINRHARARLTRLLAALTVGGLAAGACAPAPGATSTTTTAPKATTTTAPKVASTTTPKVTTTTAPRTTTTAAPAKVSTSVFTGLGAWADTYDWSPTVTGGRPSFTSASIDGLAAKGVKTLYIQTSRSSLGVDIVDEATLTSLIGRAHTKGIKVVGWYLPTFEDTAKDLKAIYAMDRLAVDGVGIDIESLKITDIALRNQRLVSESASIRSHFATRPLAAITFPPIHLTYVNPSLWSDFPWKMIGQKYDSLITMSYWTLRKAGSTYRDPTRHVTDDLTLGRQLTGRADMPIHVVGGLAESATASEVRAFVNACKANGCIGGSYYDAPTTSAANWTELAPLASLRK